TWYRSCPLRTRLRRTTARATGPLSPANARRAPAGALQCLCPPSRRELFRLVTRGERRGLERAQPSEHTWRRKQIRRRGLGGAGGASATRAGARACRTVRRPGRARATSCSWCRPGVGTAGALATGAATGGALRRSLPLGGTALRGRPLRGCPLGGRPLRSGLPLRGSLPLGRGLPLRGRPLRSGLPLRGGLPLRSGLALRGRPLSRRPLHGAPLRGRPALGSRPLRGRPLRPGPFSCCHLPPPIWASSVATTVRSMRPPSDVFIIYSANSSARWKSFRRRPTSARRFPSRFQDLRAVARPPLRPAAFFCAVVPPWDELLLRVPDPDDFPPRLEAPGEFAMRAARSFDIPFSFSFSYCFSFLTLELLLGIELPPL